MFWAQAKEGGVILSTPKRYFSRAFLPAFLGWVCKLIVTGIFLAAFALPVTFESVMWVTGSGSIANVASATPGAVGVTQATNALALKTCCNVARPDAVNYSTAQQLLTTAWNQILAIVLVIWVFGWTGGKQLVTHSYVDAKDEVERRKAEHKQKKSSQAVDDDHHEDHQHDFADDP
jgi:beta-lactamase regulating signal transducer with metallopeptidase domain